MATYRAIQKARSRMRWKRHDAPRKPYTIPETGRHLVGYAKGEEEYYDLPFLVRELLEWAEARGYPARVAEWDEDQVYAGYLMVCERVQEVLTHPERLPE